MLVDAGREARLNRSISELSDATDGPIENRVARLVPSIAVHFLDASKLVNAHLSGYGGGWVMNAATSRVALVSTPGSFRKPRSLNQSMKRLCHVPNGIPSRPLSPPACTPLP